MPAAFLEWFHQLTGHPATHEWQLNLSAETRCRNRIIRIPTGFGKTQAALAVWSYHRLHRQDQSWPRRLVWCLPMRSLVEQTAETAERMFATLPEESRPRVYTLMGGADSAPWYLYPEHPAVLIGTQDMLLSRALNRGYAAPRARWPIEFGLLNQDCLWVLDEIQLMDVGLTTASHLQSFRQQDAANRLAPAFACPAFTWWMSATLQPAWLNTIDTEPCLADWVAGPCRLAPAESHGSLWDIPKQLISTAAAIDDHDQFASLILHHHAQNADGDWGKVTLVICNTVLRACQTMEALHRQGRREGLELIHSRFRPVERSRWRATFLRRDACRPGVDLIIVATQVVEAGVDLSAGCLITELAPWSSLVQRFGRCARYGGAGTVIVVNRDFDENSALPYSLEEIEIAAEKLPALPGAGLAALERFESGLNPDQLLRLYPYEPRHLLLRREFDELFDTTPDLSGADLDISRFIRAGEDRDLQLFWDVIPRNGAPAPDRTPQASELCAVPFLLAQEWLCGAATKTKKPSTLQKGLRAWVWDWLDGQWTLANRALLLPGRIVCVASESGGYDPTVGFNRHSRLEVPVAPAPSPAGIAVESADAREDSEDLSHHAWKTIGYHSLEVGEIALQLGQLLALPSGLLPLLRIAAIWHDIGKSHPAFQGSMRGPSRPLRQDLAKAPPEAWVSRSAMYQFAGSADRRPGFRHELASTLALFAALAAYAPDHDALAGPWLESFAALGWPRPEPPVDSVVPEPVQELLALDPLAFNLVAYLIASHHGKVRLSLQAGPKDQDYPDRDGRGLPIRGVREADRLPAVELNPGQPALPALPLTLDPAAMGISLRTGISWQERCATLQQRFGPAALAYLEAIFRAADVRASQRQTPDPALSLEISL
jgi:CRISPR-associated endonuclease/helicase Cas3